MTGFITQKHYGTIEIDATEKDIVQIWMKQKDDPQVIQIEKDLIPLFIEALKEVTK